MHNLYFTNMDIHITVKVFCTIFSSNTLYPETIQILQKKKKNNEYIIIIIIIILPYTKYTTHLYNSKHAP